ncbi:hypothetical protein C0J52_13739 [Blattella germanica]|nr:hypothetical protein C0J52_13739 [Blattella germanica]
MTVICLLLTRLPLFTSSPLKGRFTPIGPGTDLGLFNEGFFEGDIVPRVDMKNAVADPELLWPYATVVFKTEDDVESIIKHVFPLKTFDIGCPESPQCEVLMKAMEQYHQHSCVRFKEWTGEKNYVSIFLNPDRLSLGQRCWYLGIVIHELGHAIGFWHEMNRPDRDEWIYVYWNNIIPGFASAFAKHDDSSVDTLNEQFDYKSIMMYDEYAFSKDGISPTLEAKDRKTIIGPIWKKPGLSKSDIRRLHKLYKCPGKNQPKSGFPYNEVCNFNQDACGFKNGGSAVWNWRTVNATGTTPGYFMSINFHGLPRKDPRGPMGCVRFWYLLQGNECNMELKLTQAYLSSPTQIFFDPDNLYDLWENDTVAGQWLHVEVPVYVTRPFKILFLSEFDQSCSYGTIGLDDIEVFYTPCETTSTTQQQTHTTFATRPPTTSPRTSNTQSNVTKPTLFNLTKPIDCITDEPIKTVTQSPSTPTVTIFPTDFMQPSKDD